MSDGEQEPIRGMGDNSKLTWAQIREQLGDELVPALWSEFGDEIWNGAQTKIWEKAAQELTTKTLAARAKIDAIMVDKVIPAVNPTMSVREFYDSKRPEIIDQTQADKANQLLKDLATARKAVTDLAAAEKAPLDDALEMIKRLLKLWLTDLDDFGVNVRAKYERYQKGKLKRDQDAKDALAAQAEKLRAEGTPEGQAIAAALDEKAAAPTVARTRGDHGATGSSKLVWKFRVKDAAKVRRELCEPKEPLVRARMKELESDGTLDKRLKELKATPGLPAGADIIINDLEAGVEFYQDVSSRVGGG